MRNRIYNLFWEIIEVALGIIITDYIWRLATPPASPPPPPYNTPVDIAVVISEVEQDLTAIDTWIKDILKDIRSDYEVGIPIDRDKQGENITKRE